MNPLKQKETSRLYFTFAALRDETDGPAYKYQRSTKKRHNKEPDHVSAWEISKTHLTPMETDVPSDFY